MSQDTDFSLLLRRGRLLLEEGRTADALAVLEAIQVETEQQQKELDYVLGWAHLQARHWSEAARILSPFHLMTERDRDPGTLNTREIQGLCLLRLGEIAIQGLRHEEAGRHLIKALKVLQDRRVQLPMARIKACYYLAGTYKMRGLFNAAIQYYQQALELCRYADDVRELAFIYNGLAEAYRAAGLFIEADESGKKAWELYRRVGNLRGQCEMLNRLGHIALRLANFSEASDYFTEALAIAASDPQGDKMVMVNCTALANLRLVEGRLEEARRFCDRAEEVSYRLNDLLMRGMTEMIIGKVRYAEAHQAEEPQRQRLMQETIDCFKQSVDKLSATQAYDLVAEVYGLWAQVLEDMGQEQQALSCWRSAFSARSAAKGPSLEEI